MNFVGEGRKGRRSYGYCREEKRKAKENEEERKVFMNLAGKRRQ